MNAVPLLLLYMFTQRDKRGAEPSWPSRSHPPPRRARRALPSHHKRAAHHGPAHHEPSQHAAESHHAAAHHSTPAGKPFESLDFSHVHAPADESQLHHPAAHHAPGGKPFTSLDFSHVHVPEQHDAAPPPVHHDAPPPPETNVPTGYSVARVQAILRGLGWRGHLTTKGPLSPDLTDGLAPKYDDQPSVTRDDWQQSAHKRGLDVTFVRLSPTTVQVDEHTYAVLRDTARSMGANVSGGRLRIP